MGIYLVYVVGCFQGTGLNYIECCDSVKGSVADNGSLYYRDFRVDERSEGKGDARLITAYEMVPVWLMNCFISMVK